MRPNAIFSQTIKNPTASFIDTMGINTHFHWKYWGQGAYSDSSRIAGHLEYLGLRHIRDMAVNLVFPELPFERLQRAGVEWTLMLWGGEESWYGFSDAKNSILSFSGRYKNAINAIEGPNEIWNWPVNWYGQSGAEGAQALQRHFYDWINSTPQLRDIPVYDYTDLTSWGAADYTNVHMYDAVGAQPHIMVRNIFSGYPQIAEAGRPVVWTETGWAVGPQREFNAAFHPPTAIVPAKNHDSLDELTQARLTLNTYAQGYASGFKQTFLYELIDPWPGLEDDDNLFSMGLFRSDHTPRLAAHALARFVDAVEQNDGREALRTTAKMSLNTTDPLLYAQGLVTDGDTKTILLWRERDIWDEKANQGTSNPPSQIRLSVEGAWASGTVINPITGETTAWNEGTTLTVGDDLLVIRVNINEVLAHGKGNPVIELTDFGSFSDAMRAGPGQVDLVGAGVHYNGQGLAAEIWRNYMTAFGREPDLQAYGAWVELRQQEGWSAQAVKAAFGASSEFQGRYGQMGNQKFVEALFGNAGVPTAAPEYGALVAALDSGAMTRTDVFATVSELPATRGRAEAAAQKGLLVLDPEAIAAHNIFQAALGRAPRADELSAIVGQIDHLHQMPVVIRDILGSWEYQQQYGGRQPTSQEFARDLFVKGLGRNPSEQEVAWWSQAVDTGHMSREVAVLGVATSSEMARVQKPLLEDGLFVL